MENLRLQPAKSSRLKLLLSHLTSNLASDIFLVRIDLSTPFTVLHFSRISIPVFSAPEAKPFVLFRK